MDDQEFLPTEGSEADAKTDVARNIAKSGDKPQEDPSRATLHYGEEARPELGGTNSNHAPPAAKESDLFQADTPSFDAATPSATAEIRPFEAHAPSATTTLAPDTGRSEQQPDIQSAPVLEAADQKASPELDFSQSPSSITVSEGNFASDVPTAEKQSDGPINAAPTEIHLESVEVAENAEGAAIGRLSVVDANSSDTHIFTLSDDRFEVVDGEVRLRPGVTLDHEAAATVQLEVTATDSGGLSVTQSFEINVLDVNEGPNSIGFEASKITENESGALVGRLTVVDPDAGDTHSYSVSDERFEVVDGEVRLKPDVALDFEDASMISIEVTATDSGGLSVSESFHVNVSDVNEGPESVSLAASPVIENEEGAVVGRVSVVDPDAGDTHTFQVSDDRFEIVNGEVRLKPGIALDHEEASSITLEVAAIDSGGLSVSERFEITIADLNEGPSSVSLESSGVAENTVGAVVGRLTTVDPDAGDNHSYSVSDDRFEVVDGEVRLKPGVSLDHEEAASIALEVTATDSGGLSFSETFDVFVSDLNEGPTRVSLDAQTVAENEAGAVVGRLSAVDPDASDMHVFTVSDERFEVVGGEVRLKPGVSLDHEEAASITLDVTATDSGGLSVTEQFSIDVSNVNEGPTSVSLDGGTVSENAEGAVIGHLSVIDPDAGDSHSFALSDERFEIVDGAIRLKPGIALDHEDEAAIRLEVTATDASGLSVKENFEVAVSDVNEGPQAISLDSKMLAENESGAVVGRLTTIDADASDIHTYTVSDDRFEVLGNEVSLKQGVSLDHEEAASITLEVTATDNGGLSVTESFNVSVTDVNEAPERIDFEGHTLIAGQEGMVVGRIEGIDADAGDTLSYTVSDDRFEVVDGDVRLKSGNAVSPDQETIEFVVTATDSGGLSVSETISLNVFDPPVVSVDSGFTADYFDVDKSLSRISDIDWEANPTHSETTQDINYANGRGSFWEGGDTDTFGVRVKGNIEVDEGGTFKFHLGGDDGAMLYVNGQPVIDNDGLHGFRTRTGEVELPEGNHHIEVRYFENYGHAGLRLEWEGPGIDGRQLVDASTDSDAIGIEGVPTPLNLDIANVGEDAVYRLDGVPEGTIVQSGNSALMADEDGSIDLTGIDLTDLTLTPPIGSAGTFEPSFFVVQNGPDGESIETSSPIEIEVTPAHLMTDDVDIFGGFHASYFDVDHSLSRLDQIDWDGKPTHEEIVTDVNYTNSRGSFWEGGSTDTFGARIEGEIEVTEGGTYKFFLGGDDGAMLFINGEPVIDNDGLHGFRTRDGKIELEPGDYSIEVRYFENYGHAGLKLEWQGPGTDGRELVTAKPDLDIEQNGSTQLAIDVGNPNAMEAVTIDGLPADTVLFLGDETLITDGGPLDVGGHDLSLMEVSPPAGFVGTIEGEVSTLSRGFNGQLTKGGTSFELSVGEDASARALTTNEDSSLMMVDSMQEKPEATAWTQDDKADQDSANDADDVMSEEISEFQISEISEGQVDTYERYDW
ncbi:MAG: PA14 domain-containing protein [Pseudomonadota bacterium]